MFLQEALQRVNALPAAVQLSNPALALPDIPLAEETDASSEPENDQESKPEPVLPQEYLDAIGLGK